MANPGRCAGVDIGDAGSDDFGTPEPHSYIEEFFGEDLVNSMRSYDHNIDRLYAYESGSTSSTALLNKAKYEYWLAADCQRGDPNSVSDVGSDIDRVIGIIKGPDSLESLSYDYRGIIGNPSHPFYPLLTKMLDKYGKKVIKNDIQAGSYLAAGLGIIFTLFPSIPNAVISFLALSAVFTPISFAVTSACLAGGLFASYRILSRPSSGFTKGASWGMLGLGSMSFSTGAALTALRCLFLLSCPATTAMLASAAVAVVMFQACLWFAERHAYHPMLTFKHLDNETIPSTLSRIINSDSRSGSDSEDDLVPSRTRLILDNEALCKDIIKVKREDQSPNWRRGLTWGGSLAVTAAVAASVMCAMSGPLAVSASLLVPPCAVIVIAAAAAVTWMTAVKRSQPIESKLSSVSMELLGRMGNSVLSVAAGAGATALLFGGLTATAPAVAPMALVAMATSWCLQKATSSMAYGKNEAQDYLIEKCKVA